MSSEKNEFERLETLDTLEEFTESLQSKTNANVLAEEAAVDLEMRQLKLVIMREQVASIKAKHNAKYEEGQSKLLAIRQFLATREANRDKCNHRKGGMGADAVVHGQGTDAMFAVIKHGKPNGTWMVLCARCGKEWHQDFYVQGVLVEAGTGEEEFRKAINLPTDSSPSKSSSFEYRITTPGSATQSGRL